MYELFLLYFLLVTLFTGNSLTFLKRNNDDSEAKYNDDSNEQTDDIETLETLSNTLETLNAWTQYQRELQRLKDEKNQQNFQNQVWIEPLPIGFERGLFQDSKRDSINAGNMEILDTIPATQHDKVPLISFRKSPSTQLRNYPEKLTPRSSKKEKMWDVNSEELYRERKLRSN